MRENGSLGWNGSPGCVPVSNSVPSGRKGLVGGLMDASSRGAARVALDRMLGLVATITWTSLIMSSKEVN